MLKRFSEIDNTEEIDSIVRGGVCKVKKFKVNRLFGHKGWQKKRGVKRPNFKEAIKANRKWEGVRRSKCHKDIKADSKKVGNFFINLFRLQEKVLE